MYAIRSYYVIEATKAIGLKPLKNPCPYDGHTKRQEIKEHIKALGAISPEVYDHLASAMRNAPNQELWPEQLAHKAIVKKFHEFWQKKHK